MLNSGFPRISNCLDRWPGSVRDASGAVIPGATVMLISATRGTTVETSTNGNGDFTFPNAVGDTYTVRVT